MSNVSQWETSAPNNDAAPRVTLELAGTTTAGNRTLAAKGFAFIYFRANGVGVVRGNGVV